MKTPPNSRRDPELTLTVLHARERGKPKGHDPIDWKKAT